MLGSYRSLFSFDMPTSLITTSSSVCMCGVLLNTSSALAGISSRALQYVGQRRARTSVYSHFCPHLTCAKHPRHTIFCLRVDLNEGCFFVFFRHFPEISVFHVFSYRKIPKYRENIEKKLKNTLRKIPKFRENTEKKLKNTLR